MLEATTKPADSTVDHAEIVPTWIDWAWIPAILLILAVMVIIDESLRDRNHD